MTDEVYEYQQSMQEQAMAAHRTPISQTRIASEAENHKKDGPCQTIVLPNLPSVAKRIRVNKASLYYWINGNTTPNAAGVKKIKYYIENLSPAAMDFKKAHDDVQKK